MTKGYHDSENTLNLMITELKQQLEREVLNKEEDNTKSVAMIASLCEEKEALEIRLQTAQEEAQINTMSLHSKIEELSCLLRIESDKNADLCSKAAEDSLSNQKQVDSLRTSLLELERKFDGERVRYEAELLAAKTENEKLEDNRSREKIVRTGVITALKKENENLRTKMETDQREQEVALQDLQEKLSIISAQQEISVRKIKEQSSEISRQLAENLLLEQKCENEKIHYERLMTEAAEKASTEQAVLIAEKRAVEASLLKLQADFSDLSQQLSDEKHTHSLAVASHESSLAEATDASLLLLEGKRAAEESLLTLQEKYDELRVEKEAEAVVVAVLKDELLELQQSGDSEKQKLSIELEKLAEELNEERSSKGRVVQEIEEMQAKIAAAAAFERREIEVRLTQKYDDLVRVLEKERAVHESSLSKALQYSSDDVEVCSIFSTTFPILSDILVFTERREN